MSTIHIFVSYSREDKRWLDPNDEFGLIPWLARSLRRDGVEFWYDRTGIEPGDKFQPLIEQEIDRADIAILLVSHGFRNSEFIETVELPRIKARVERGEMVAIPILVEPCSWDDIEFISSRQMLPGGPTPLLDHTETDRSWAYVRDEILRGIRRRIEMLRQSSVPRAGEPVETPQAEMTPTPGTAPKPPKEPDQQPGQELEGLSGAEPIQPADVRAAVEAAIQDVVATSRVGMGGASVEDNNSGTVWKRLHDVYQGREIAALCALLQELTHDWMTHWKAVTLLSYCLRTAVGRHLASDILDAVALWLGAAPVLQSAALECITEAPVSTVSTREKWSRLYASLAVMPTARTQAIIRALPQFTPREETQRTAAAILDIAACTTDSGVLVAATEALRRLDYREGAHRIREIVAAAPVETAASLAYLLATWADKESAPAIRQSIENHRGGTNLRWPNMVWYLYVLEGGACAEYVAELLLSAVPDVQRQMLRLEGAVTKIKEAAVLDAVRELAETTRDPDVKKEAKAFLAKARADT